MSKGKLHELLAVENDLEKVSSKLIAESARTFNKENLFSGQVRRLVHFDAADQMSDTEDAVELTTTVRENLDYLVDPISRYWDAVLQKEATNQTAKADLIIDGVTIATGVPATFLLGMEKKLNKLRELYESIPTLAPGINWTRDEAKGVNIFRADDTVQFKTKKDIEFRTAAEATKEHKAQVIQMETTVNTGKYTTTKWSGMVTPYEKAEMLERFDAAIVGVKRSRMKANNVDVVKVNIGKDILDYING